MDFSLNINNKDFITYNNHQIIFDEHVSHIQTNHLSSFSDNVGQSSLNGWTSSPNRTDISNHYQQNTILSIANQNYDPFTSQNYRVYNLPTSNIPSKYLIRSISSYSKSDAFGESTNKNQNSIPTDLFNNFNEFRGNTIPKEDFGNQPFFNNNMIDSQTFDLPEEIKNPSTEITNKMKSKKMATRYKPLRKSTIIKRKWTDEEDKNLEKSTIIKGKWTDEEDKKLVENVKLYGTKKWGIIAKTIEGREGKQCRERWHNHLRPNLKKGDWTAEENQILVKAHQNYGGKWTDITKNLPGRSENTIKNHWNATKRRMQSMNTKENGENANPPRNILENYIMHVAINNYPPKTFESPNTMDDYDYKDMFDGEMNLSIKDTTKTTEPLVDASTSSYDVPEPTMFLWENDITEVCKSMGDTYNLIWG